MGTATSSALVGLGCGGQGIVCGSVAPRPRVFKVKPGLKSKLKLYLYPGASIGKIAPAGMGRRRFILAIIPGCDIISYKFLFYTYTGAKVAQSVEQGTENPCVGGSIPSLGTIIWGHLHKGVPFFLCPQNMLSVLGFANPAHIFARNFPESKLSGFFLAKYAAKRRAIFPH